jgi:hypothetical protein
LLLMFLQERPLINAPAAFAVAQIVTILVVIVTIAWLGRNMIGAASGSTGSNPESNAGSSQGERSSRDLGSFYVVAFGITAVFFGFIIMLLFANTFTENIATALGFLTALFGAITGLVGTYFGVKSSSDARQGAQDLASGTRRTPTITITPPEATAAVSAEHTVIATVLNIGGTAAAGVPVTFSVTTGPDSTDINPAVVPTDASGQAPFTVTNGGQSGTDTIEATALGGRGTATVTFDKI